MSGAISTGNKIRDQPVTYDSSEQKFFVTVDIRGEKTTFTAASEKALKTKVNKEFAMESVEALFFDRIYDKLEKVTVFPKENTRGYSRGINFYGKLSNSSKRTKLTNWDLFVWNEERFNELKKLLEQKENIEKKMRDIESLMTNLSDYLKEKAEKEGEK